MYPKIYHALLFIDKHSSAFERNCLTKRRWWIEECHFKLISIMWFMWVDIIFCLCCYFDVQITGVKKNIWCIGRYCTFIHLVPNSIKFTFQLEREKWNRCIQKSQSIKWYRKWNVVLSNIWFKVRKWESGDRNQSVLIQNHDWLINWIFPQNAL